MDIYSSLMNALNMEDAEDLCCYPVRASASGAIAELIEVRFDFGIMNRIYLPPVNMPLTVFCAFCRTVMLRLTGLPFCKLL